MTQVTVPDIKRDKVKAITRITVILTGVLLAMSTLIKYVTYVSDVLNERVILLIADLCAQSTDLRLNDTCLRVKMKSPYAIKQHRPGDDATFVSHQIFK